MKISNIEFTDSEWAAILKLAAQNSLYISDLSDPNKLRLALSLPIKQRGGARPNTGKRVKASALHPSGDAEPERAGGRQRPHPGRASSVEFRPLGT